MDRAFASRSQSELMAEVIEREAALPVSVIEVLTCTVGPFGAAQDRLRRRWRVKAVGGGLPSGVDIEIKL